MWGRTYDRKRSDQTLSNTLARRGRPHKSCLRPCMRHFMTAGPDVLRWSWPLSTFRTWPTQGDATGFQICRSMSALAKLRRRIEKSALTPSFPKSSLIRSIHNCLCYIMTRYRNVLAGIGICWNISVLSVCCLGLFMGLWRTLRTDWRRYETAQHSSYQIQPAGGQ
jgi:hypothetical protein